MAGKIRVLAIGAAVLFAGAAGAQQARAPTLMALKSIEPGRWRLHEIGTQGSDRAICLRDAQRLLQIEHPTSRCSRFVIDDTAQTTTVHYTCPGAGHGRTSIKVESRGLIDIQTQGLAGGLPFDVHYEGRRVGSC